MSGLRVFLIAGEVSGDKLGGALMEGLRALVPDVTFMGVGGPLMEAQGLKSRFDMAELSLMGLAEILPKYVHLKRRIRETAEAVIAEAPDVLITIDSPDFCLRVARLVKAASAIRTVHYVAPSVWAWRPKRADKMAGVIDQVLALLPFEPPYMERAGMRCDFVGHPVVAEPTATAEDEAALRARFDLGNAPVMVVLPGSRRGEVGRLMGRFGETCAKVLAQRPDMRVVIPAAAPVADMVREALATWPVPAVMIDPAEMDPAAHRQAKLAAFRAADVALAASGTVSLELAAHGTPMVIAYDMNWLSRKLISRLLLVDTVTLVNLVTDTRHIPEFIGENCTPDHIALAIEAVLADPCQQRAAMADTMLRLGLNGEAPGLRAARAVLDGLSASGPISESDG